MSGRINLSGNNQDEAAYLVRAQETMADIEAQLEAAFDAHDIDYDMVRSGGVLTISLPKNLKMVLNLQSPMQQIWLATKNGGFHYAWTNNVWTDTRDESMQGTLNSRLESELLALCGLKIRLKHTT